MLNTFYAAFAPLSFTVLGLWFVVVQTRHSEWIVSDAHRRRASVVALQFALPGLMSLLALVAPGSAIMWRVSFAATSIAGAIALVALFVYGRRRFGILEIGHILSFFLFVVVAVVAISPSVVANVGLRVAPLRVEATLLSLLVFTGISVAWIMLFEPVSEEKSTSSRRR
jgi:hypothetical protein